MQNAECSLAWLYLSAVRVHAEAERTTHLDISREQETLGRNKLLTS